MPSLVSVAELKSLVSSGLSDADLQLVIDREEAYLDRLFGPANPTPGGMVEKRLPTRNMVYTRRPIVSVVSVKEIQDGVETTLTTTDYRVWPWSLERVGRNWGELIEITYVPVDDTLERKRVIIELCRLTLSQRGMKSESIAGEYSYTALDYDPERKRIVASMNRDPLFGP